MRGQRRCWQPAESMCWLMCPMCCTMKCTMQQPGTGGCDAGCKRGGCSAGFLCPLEYLSVAVSLFARKSGFCSQLQSSLPGRRNAAAPESCAWCQRRLLNRFIEQWTDVMGHAGLTPSDCMHVMRSLTDPPNAVCHLHNAPVSI